LSQSHVIFWIVVTFVIGGVVVFFWGWGDD
jgi:hypothetical protein